MTENLQGMDGFHRRASMEGQQAACRVKGRVKKGDQLAQQQLRPLTSEAASYREHIGIAIASNPDLVQKLQMIGNKRQRDE